MLSEKAREVNFVMNKRATNAAVQTAKYAKDAKEEKGESVIAQRGIAVAQSVNPEFTGLAFQPGAWHSLP
jgi:hypothetical protein